MRSVLYKQYFLIGVSFSYELLVLKSYLTATWIHSMLLYKELLWKKSCCYWALVARWHVYMMYGNAKSNQYIAVGTVGSSTFTKFLWHLIDVFVFVNGWQTEKKLIVMKDISSCFEQPKRNLPGKMLLHMVKVRRFLPQSIRNQSIDIFWYSNIRYVSRSKKKLMYVSLFVHNLSNSKLM